MERELVDAIASLQSKTVASKITVVRYADDLVFMRENREAIEATQRGIN